MKKKQSHLMGRPRSTPMGSKRIGICIPFEQVEIFRRLGGSKWVQNMISEATQKKEKKDAK